MPPYVCTYHRSGGYLFIQIRGRWAYKLGRGGMTRLTLLSTGVTKLRFYGCTVSVPVHVKMYGNGTLDFRSFSQVNLSMYHKYTYMYQVCTWLHVKRGGGQVKLVSKKIF